MHHAPDDMSEMQMGEMHMSDMQMSSAMNQETEPNIVGLPDAGCGHCISHSQLPAKLPTLREAEQAKRGEDVTAPLALADAVSPSTLFILPVHTKQHAPPGATTSRHVLINVFRI
jgi:hypothetical protein